MPTTQTIPIDLNTRGANPVAFTHQGDTARAFAFEVYNNGEAFALTGYTAKIGAILPADRGYTVIAGNDMATGSISENTITATLPSAYTAKAGHGLLTIILTGSGGTLRPINIDLRIQKSADADDVIAGASDFPDGMEEIAEEVFQEYLSTYLPPVAPSSSAAANKAADAKLTGQELDNLKSDLDNCVTADKMQKCELITKESINKWNVDALESGLLHTNGQVYTGGSYDNYCYCNIGDVSAGDIVTSYRSSGGTIIAETMQRVVAYDSNGDVLSSDGATSVNTYVVPDGVESIKVTVTKTVSSDNYMVIINAESAPVTYIPYTLPTQYYVATDEFIGKINIDENTNFDTEYLDYSMVNRVNPSECVSGKFLNGVSGAISDNASYFVTGYMPIREGETLYAYRTYTIEPTNMRTVAVYDENKNLISSYGVNAETQSITYRDGMAYIRACMLLSNGTGGVWQTPETIMLVAHPSPISTPTYESKPKIKGDYTIKKIYVYSTDDESTVIQKMVSAYNLTDCDVVFERSTYTFGTVLPNVMTLYGLSRNEIPIGNNCRYYFNGATLEAEIDLATLGTDFNCNLLGTQYKPTNFEMHDGILIATDTRYVVHDEAATLAGSYKHLYQNMVMEYRTNASTDAYRKCIGGGTGASGVVEIVGCKFTTDASEVDVSYHGNAYDIVGAEFMLSIRDSWFSKSARAGELSTHQTGKVFLSGNSSATAFQTNFSGWDVTSFNNEVRN